MTGRGRPSLYTTEIAKEICEQLAAGKSLRKICLANDMPAEATVRSWVIDDLQGFSAQYTRARDLCLDCMADETLDISDTTVTGVKTKTTDDKVETMEGDMIEHRRLQVDTRKWYLSKLAPKRYGDRLHQEHSGAISLEGLVSGSLKPEKS